MMLSDHEENDDGEMNKSSFSLEKKKALLLYILFQTSSIYIWTLEMDAYLDL